MSSPGPPAGPPDQENIPGSSSGRHAPKATLPPGALQPGIPGVAGLHSPAQRYPSNGGFGDGDRKDSGQRIASGAGYGEFGVPSQPQQAYSSSSGSRRPLPTQPVPAPLLPPAASTNSLGTSRRTLPTPPIMAGPSTASGYAAEPPKPPPRPTGETALPPVPFRRALPALPSTSTPQGRVPSGSQAPPGARPLPNPAEYSPFPPPQPSGPSGGREPPLPLAALSRQPSDRLSGRPENFFDSPVSFAGSSSTPGYFGEAGPSRATSQSYFLSHSASIASTVSRTTGSHSDLTNETRPTSIATSWTGHDGWQPKLDKFEEVEGVGSNVTVRPPSRGASTPPSVAGHAAPDGRRTPTLQSRRTSPPNPANPILDSHQRYPSSSKVSAVDAGLPATPIVIPKRSLRQKHSFLDTPNTGGSGSSSPQIPSGEPSIRRHSSSASRNTNYSSDASSGQPVPFSPFPEPHPIGPRRHPSNRSSLHPSTTSGRPPSELSPSWAQQAQPPAHWVERKLQIHESHRDDFDSQSYPLGDDEYEDENGDWGEEEEEEEPEVNEIQFFIPAFLSESALQLKYRVQRRRQTKAGIAWVGAFTGRDIVVRRRRSLVDIV